MKPLYSYLWRLGLWIALCGVLAFFVVVRESQVRVGISSEALKNLVSLAEHQGENVPPEATVAVERMMQHELSSIGTWQSLGCMGNPGLRTSVREAVSAVVAYLAVDDRVLFDVPADKVNGSRNLTDRANSLLRSHSCRILEHPGKKSKNGDMQ